MRAILLISVLAWAYCGCTPPARSAADYLAAQLKCVDAAHTKQEANACICDVKQAWGRPCD